MKIGVDVTCWANRRGFGRFTRELLRAIAAYDRENAYVFFSDRETAEQGRFPDGVDVVTANTREVPVEAASASGRRSLFDLWAMTRQVWRHQLDVFFFPAVYSYFPVLNRTKIVVTVHDVIAQHYPRATFPNKKLELFWNAKQSLAIHQADVVLTVSEYSRQSICTHYGLSPSRVCVTTEAAHEIFGPRTDEARARAVAERYGVPEDGRVLLYVGGISPHKNLGNVVRALGLLADRDGLEDLCLVLVGDYERDAFHSDYPRLVAEIRDRGLEPRVRFTGYVPDDELVYLYNRADLFVFPSLEEGFGLPAVEAMQCGTPIVASNRGSLPEVVGEAGRFFDPLQVGDIARSIREVLADDRLRHAMRARGLERARGFTWEEAARRTVRAFEAGTTEGNG